jgi:putative mRNA 3-end processing factor
MTFLNHQLYIDQINAYIDPNVPRDLAIITHGHADHARFGHKHVIATPQTIAIMKARYGENCAEIFQPLELRKTITIGGIDITLYPAGHVLGSAQVLLDDGKTRIVVTGDYKRGSDSTCEDYEIVPCDILVTEATFGLPVFQHPPAAQEIQKLIQSVNDNPSRAHLIGAYALGKGQRVIKLLREAGYDKPIYLHGAHRKLCDLYQDHGIDLGVLENVGHRNKAEFAGEIIIAPPSALKDRWSRRFPDPVISMASGWMQVKQRARQRGVELPLMISDHCDWNELLQTIKDTGAHTIWVTHGREDALVHYCQTVLGLTAEPLSIQGLGEEGEDE